MSEPEDFDSRAIFDCWGKAPRPVGFDATFLHF
jgi:hypothetical protein